MTKVLASPERRTVYSANIVEATAQYDLGLIEEGWRAARRLSQLRRFVLLAEVMVPLRAEQRHDIAILQTLLICSDELESVDLGVLFRIEVRLTVIGFEAKDAGRSSESGDHFTFNAGDNVWAKGVADLMESVAKAARNNFERRIVSIVAHGS